MHCITSLTSCGLLQQQLVTQTWEQAVCRALLHLPGRRRLVQAAALCRSRPLRPPSPRPCRQRRLLPWPAAPCAAPCTGLARLRFWSQCYSLAHYLAYYRSRLEPLPKQEAEVKAPQSQAPRRRPTITLMGSGEHVRFNESSDSLPLEKCRSCRNSLLHLPLCRSGFFKPVLIIPHADLHSCMPTGLTFFPHVQ